MVYEFTGDAVDMFAVEFTARECVLAGKHYPLGCFAAEALDRIPEIEKIQSAAERVKEDLLVFLTARDPSSAGMAYESIGVLWKKLMTLPVYEQLLRDERRAQAMISELRMNPASMDELMARGTEQHLAFEQWLSQLERLESDLKHFAQNIGWMLEDHFEGLPSRRRERYAEVFRDYRAALGEAYLQREGTGEEPLMVDLDTQEFEFPVNLAFVYSKDSDTGLPCIAERMTFEKLSSFLYVDFYKGMAAGNLPRRCAHCGRWFLTKGGYNTMYCGREVPGADGKTCRMIGAHEKEKAENQKDVRKVYKRIYNKLKSRKFRGSITSDKWNQQVAAAQQLMDDVSDGKIVMDEYERLMDEL